MSYAKVEREHLWNDETFRAWPEHARMLWIYLLSCPSGNSFGYFRLRDGEILDHLQWSHRQLKRAWEPILRDKKVFRDVARNVVFLPNACRFNRPDNPNVLKSWEKLINSVPSSALREQFIAALIQNLDTDWAKEWAKGLPKGLPNLDQTDSPSPSPSPSPNNSIPSYIPPKILEKKPYGEFKNVLLTDTEYYKLKERFNSDFAQRIEALSAGIESKGYKYKSHYATILTWERLEQKHKTQEATNAKNQSIAGNRPAGAFEDVTE